MMKLIRLRFIRIALLALSLAMLLVAGAINAVHIVSTVNEQYETLQYLTENQNNYSKKKQGGNKFCRKRSGRKGVRHRLYRYPGCIGNISKGN